MKQPVGQMLMTGSKQFFTMLLFGLVVTAQLSTATGQVRWGGSVLRQDSAWFDSSEARKAADTLLLYQTPHGAWPKNTDLFQSLPAEELERIRADKGSNTIDNGATTTPLRFLARMIQATSESKYTESFEQGLEYLLEAQYPNGGWPQYYPLRNGYYSRVTFNDNAMVNVLEILRDVAKGGEPYGFVDADLRVRAGAALERGIDCILQTQIRQNGRLAGWCAQYDEHTLEPAWARSYEPPSISGSESVGIVRFLMSLEEPSPERVAAVEGAVKWFQSVAIEGVCLESFHREDGSRDRRLVSDPDGPPLWARFYEIGTNRPLFLDRDSVFHYDYAEISRERRTGYSYLGGWPRDLLNEDFPQWINEHRSNRQDEGKTR